jgi:tRNA uridine 5-carboxymethylaminomethyl modification enzyme
MNLRQVMAALAMLDRWEAVGVAPWLIDRAEVAAKYSAFIEKELKEADRQRLHYGQEIPGETDFSQVTGLRVEAMNALERSRPSSIGQAVRTAGVTPSDIGVLLVHLKRMKSAARHSTKEYNGAR